MIDLNTLQCLDTRILHAFADFVHVCANIRGENHLPARTDDSPVPVNTTLEEVRDKIEAIVQAPPVPEAPPAPSVAEVAAHTELPPAPPVSGPLPERDSAGLPWDGRIHSSSKAILQDGTWRQKRGVDVGLLAAVTAELKAAMAVPAPAPVLSVVPPPPFVASAVPPAPPVSISLAPESVGAAPTASPSSGPITFPQLMRKITDGIIAKTIDQTHVSAACATVGLPSIISLKDRPDLVEAVATALGVQL